MRSLGLHVFATYIAIVVAIVLASLATAHVYWAVGGKAGAAVVPTRPGGAQLFAPGRISTLAVAGALLLGAGVVLGRAGAMPRVVPEPLYRLGAWVLGAVFTLRAIGDFRYVGLFKRVHGTRFATLDTRWYTPLCATLAVAVLYLAVGK